MSNEPEINRKRKSNDLIPQSRQHDEDDEGNFLSLSLSFRSTRPRESSPPPHPLLFEQQPPPPPPPLFVQQPPPPPPPPPPQLQALLTQSPTPPPLQLSPSHSLYMTPIPPGPARRAGPLQQRQPRARRNPTQAPREGKSDTVPALFPWATTRRATVHSLSHLLSENINSVKGEVQCKRCDKRYNMEYDLRAKFMEVGTFIVGMKDTMHDRAPETWMNPILPKCDFCGQENSAKPVIAEKKKEINWLFLLLGQTLGCCTLEQLKYFCKHTKNHRTGAKDRVLYLTYLALCKQLDPNGPFDVRGSNTNGLLSQ